jgi:hypothetical protein
MADTTALISLEQIVSTFLFGYKKQTEDYSLYVQHAARAVEDFNLYDGNIPTTLKVTIDTTLKCIDMPDDMQQFVELVTPIEGQWWSFTEKSRIVNTTTFTGAVEGRDVAQGEGVEIVKPRVTTYGAKGGWNKFNYTIDWKARRIYFDDTYNANDYVVLIYISSGINASGETTVPAFMVPLIEAYLFHKETYWIPELARERQIRFDDYWKEKMKIRGLINSMTVDQWRDIFLSNVTQTIQR